MKTIKGPAIFLAQFAGDEAPYNSLDSIADWVAGLGYKGIQIPSWDARLFDLGLAAESQTYCDEVKGMLADKGLEITELSTHLQGQLVAVHPAFDAQFDGFAPEAVHGNPKARQEWAVQQVKNAAIASRRLGLTAHATFSGALAWPYFYPWPARPAGLVEDAFDELARRWKPILDVFDENGVDAAYEIHPGEDLHDGVTFEMFLERVGNHPRANILYDPSHFVLQQLDYLAYIDIYHERIKCFHVKDAEFRPNGRSGFMAAISHGSIARAGSAVWVTGRSISRRSSPRWPPTISPAGPCSNGNARSSIQSRARPKVRRSSPSTSSASPNMHLTISPPVVQTGR
jgi:sugar phosphate isomerase/epimerase